MGWHKMASDLSFDVCVLGYTFRLLFLAIPVPYYKECLSFPGQKLEKSDSFTSRCLP